jgi:hypothetical protein
MQSVTPSCGEKVPAGHLGTQTLPSKEVVPVGHVRHDFEPRRVEYFGAQERQLVTPFDDE